MGAGAVVQTMDVASKATLDAVNQSFELPLSTKPKDRIFMIMENFKHLEIYHMPSDVKRARDIDLYDGASVIIYHLMQELTKSQDTNKESLERCEGLKKRCMDALNSRDIVQKDLVAEREAHLQSKRILEDEIVKTKNVAKNETSKAEKEILSLESRRSNDQMIIQELKTELEQSREAALRDADLTADLMITMTEKDARIAELVEYIPRMTSAIAQLSSVTKANVILRESLRDATSRLRSSCTTRGNALESVQKSIELANEEVKIILDAAYNFKIDSIKKQAEDDNERRRNRRPVRILPLPRELRKAKLKIAQEQLEYFKISNEAAVMSQMVGNNNKSVRSKWPSQTQTNSTHQTLYPDKPIVHSPIHLEDGGGSISKEKNGRVNTGLFTQITKNSISADELNNSRAVFGSKIQDIHRKTPNAPSFDKTFSSPLKKNEYDSPHFSGDLNISITKHATMNATRSTDATNSNHKSFNNNGMNSFDETSSPNVKRRQILDSNH